APGRPATHFQGKRTARSFGSWLLRQPGAVPPAARYSSKRGRGRQRCVGYGLYYAVFSQRRLGAFQQAGSAFRLARQVNLSRRAGQTAGVLTAGILAQLVVRRTAYRSEPIRRV